MLFIQCFTEIVNISNYFLQLIGTKLSLKTFQCDDFKSNNAIDTIYYSRKIDLVGYNIITFSFLFLVPNNCFGTIEAD